MIVQTIAKVLTGELFDTVEKLGTAYLNKEISKEQFKAEMYKALLASLTSLWVQQASVIKAEINADDKLTRRWRPTVALCFAGIIIWYSFFVPILVNWLGAPPLQVGEKLLLWVMSLLTVCITGYVGGRSVEKVTSILKGR